MNDIVENVRTQLKDEIQLVAAKIAPELLRNVAGVRARAITAQVDPEDLQERAAGRPLRRGACRIWNFARSAIRGRARRARVQPDGRGARLAVDAHDHRDRQRRHAVPRRFGDDGGQPPRPHAAPDHSSDLIAVERARRRHADRPRADDRQTRQLRIVHPRRGRPHRPTHARSTRWPPTSTACSDDVRAAVDDWKPMQDKARAIVADARAAPPPLPADELDRRHRVPELARRQPLHASRLSLPRPGRRSMAQDALQIVPGSSLGILRETRRARTSRRASRRCRRKSARMRARPELLDHHQVDVALDRASAGLPRLHRGQALRRRGRGDAASIASSGSSRRRRYSANPADIPLLRRKTANVDTRAQLAARRPRRARR